VNYLELFWRDISLTKIAVIASSPKQFNSARHYHLSDCQDTTSPHSSAMGSKTKKLAKKRSRKTKDKEFREVDIKKLNEIGTSRCPEFSTISTIHDTEKLVDVRDELGTVRDNLSIFFTASGNMDSRFEVEEFEYFCRGVSLADVVAAKGPAGNQRIAWTDDRISGPDLEESKVAREYENPLTATGLLRALNKLRFNDENLLDAARRLVYVTDLSPTCIYHSSNWTDLRHPMGPLRRLTQSHGDGGQIFPYEIGDMRIAERIRSQTKFGGHRKLISLVSLLGPTIGGGLDMISLILKSMEFRPNRSLGRCKWIQSRLQISPRLPRFGVHVSIGLKSSNFASIMSENNGSI
jgi:hypothetical protein